MQTVDYKVSFERLSTATGLKLYFRHNGKRVAFNLSQKLKNYYYRNKTYISCFYCGLLLTREKATIEHLTTRKSGGTFHPMNAMVSCGKDNSRRGVLSVAGYRKIVAAKYKDRIIPDHIIDIEDHVTFKIHKKHTGAKNE